MIRRTPRSRRPLATRSSLTGRIYFNFRALPGWIQYVMALATVAIVVSLAWRVGKDRPTPEWITKYLVPSLGWLYIALVVYVLLWVLYRVRAARRHPKGEPPT